MALLTTDEIVQRLHGMPAFQGLDDAALRGIADKMEVQFASQGHPLYKIGQIAERMYIVESGLVMLQERTRLDKPRDVGRMGPGSVLGLEAVAQSLPYTQTALVAEPTTVFSLDRPAIQDILATYPFLRRRLDRYGRQQQRLNRLNLPSRLDDEVILVYARPHWTALLGRLIWPILALAGIAVLSGGLFAFLHDALISAGLITFSLLGFVLVMLAYSFADWWFDTYIVTNQRVISMLRRPFIHEKLQEAPIGKIQNTSLQFPSFSAHYLGWSNINISTAGGPPITFKRIAQGPRVNAVIQELVAEARQRGTVQAREARQQQIETRLRGVANAAPPPNPPPPRANSRSRTMPYFIPQLRSEERDSQGALTITYRKHWIVLLLETIFWLFLLALLGAVGVGGVATGVLISMPLLGIPLGVGMLATFLYLWWLYEDWRNDLYILTPTAVLDIERRPLYLSEKSTQAGLDAIQDVSYVMSNPIAEMFNYGDLLIQTAGPQGQVKWDHVPDPREVRREINERIAEFQRKRAERTRKELDDDIQEWVLTERRIQGNTPPTP